MCVSARNLSVGALELLGLQCLVRLSTACLISDAACHAADILEARKHHANDPNYFTRVGLVDPKKPHHLEYLLSLCECFCPSDGEPDVVELWDAYCDMLSYIHDTHNIPTFGHHAWSSFPNHPGHRPSLAERNLLSTARLVLEDQAKDSGSAESSDAASLMLPTTSKASQPMSPDAEAQAVDDALKLASPAPPIATLTDEPETLSPVKDKGKGRAVYTPVRV
jgi:hypothetical protein